MLSEEAFLVAAAPARYGVICLSASMKTHNIPGKLLSYLAAGIPVFAVGVRGSALHRVIEELNCGVFVDASDPASIASMIRLVAHDDAARHTHQLAAIAARSKFCVKTAVDQIISQSHRDS